MIGDPRVAHGVRVLFFGLFLGLLSIVTISQARGGGGFNTFLPLVSMPRGLGVIPSEMTFESITDIDNVGDERIFVTERAGLVKVIQPDGSVSIFLDILGRVQDDGYELGLFSIAFDPDYANNGFFYVAYTSGERNNWRMNVSRFSVSAEDPNYALPGSEFSVMTYGLSAEIHNGGALEFSPFDGHLYYGSGDDTASDSAQQPDDRRGKIWRIRTSDQSYSKQLWASGFRNVWKIAFHPETGDLFVGEVGDLIWEEINFIPAGTPGLNFGWPCIEGTDILFTGGICANLERFTAPFYQYDHDEGCSIILGEFQRIGGIEKLVFGDYCNPRIKTLHVVDGNPVVEEVGSLPDDMILITTFGTNHLGNLLIGRQFNNPLYDLHIP